MDWITDRIAIGSWDEATPMGAHRLDLRLIPDHSAIPLEVFRLAIGLIDEALSRGENVFVHCIGGVSRSPVIVAAWLVRREGMSVNGALSLIRNHRPSIEPHPEQLRSLEKFVSLEA